MDDIKQSVAVRDNRGRFLTVPPNAAPPITSATARSMVEKRKAKAASLLRSRIAEETREVSTLPIRDGAEAVAEAGAMIWRETVLSQDVYPRDRLAAWETIGKHAQILGMDKAQAGTDTSGQTVGRVGAVAVLLVRAGVVADVVDGTVTWEGGQDTDADGEGAEGRGGDG